MPGRTYQASPASKYRYGFNGKENDNEVKGDGNQQDYGMRIYDPRLGRFLSIDPITKKYPELTPYQFASNSPIAGIDMDGLEFYFAADGTFLGQSVKGGTEIRVATNYSLIKGTKTYEIKNYSNIDKVSESVASKVYGTIYKREIKDGSAKSVSASKQSSSAAGSTDPDKNITIYYTKKMSSDDGTNPILAKDYYDAANILFHEDLHAKGIGSTGIEHFKIAIAETKSKNWNNTTSYNKENTKFTAGSYLMDEVNGVLFYQNKGDLKKAAIFKKQYESDLKIYNKTFKENAKSFFSNEKEKK